MKTIIINEEKIIIAEEGKVLTNGGEFAEYPIELVTNINDDTWYEIDEPIVEDNTTEQYL